MARVFQRIPVWCQDLEDLLRFHRTLHLGEFPYGYILLLIAGCAPSGDNGISSSNDVFEGSEIRERNGLFVRECAH